MTTNRPPCTRCGRPSYQTVRVVTPMKHYATEPRCFPHSAPTTLQYRDAVSKQLRRDAKYALSHIDRGFSYEAWANDEREKAYGGRLVSSNPSTRIGLER